MMVCLYALYFEKQCFKEASEKLAAFSGVFSSYNLANYSAYHTNCSKLLMFFVLDNTNALDFL